MHVLIVFQVLKVPLINIYKMQIPTSASYFISCCFILAFTSTDVIFHKFLELHSTLSEKRFLSINCPFLVDLLQAHCSKSSCLQEKVFLCEGKFTEQLKSN